ncbi:hypothetical protein BR93DRAFT_881329 [Coniochaeta sp. PMI_546]|nr:hypothetical protein BR93DRAFT_881329 [Coniochaeta sp. PMI_546]
MLPYDAKFRLWLNMRARESMWTPRASDLKWLSKPAAYPVDWKRDVGIIMKSGFGTQHRIPAWLEAVREVGDLVFIADFATKPGEHYSKDGRQLPVHDAVGTLFGQGVFSGSDLEQPRAEKYRNMSAAIARGDADAAKEMSKKFGWELDAMKFISGLELAYEQMPDKKWYVLVDDDTYIVQDSMILLLERLDPDKQYYLGNPVGNWLCRFAHGGSSVIMSGAAVRNLYSPRNERIVAESNRESLTETWGDRLLASTFLRIGVYLDETYMNLFNGERPLISWIRADRFCAPVVSFHGLANPEDMRQTGETFRNIRKIVRWIDLWEMNGAPAPETFKKNPLRQNWDHVGRLDERSWTTTDLESAAACHAACKKTPRQQCLAWTWDEKEHKCHRAPWMIVGAKAEGKIAGLNEGRVSALAAACK